MPGCSGVAKLLFLGMVLVRVVACLVKRWVLAIDLRPRRTPAAKAVVSRLVLTNQTMEVDLLGAAAASEAVKTLEGGNGKQQVNRVSVARPIDGAHNQRR